MASNGSVIHPISSSSLTNNKKKFQFRKEEEKKEKNAILSTQAIGPKPGENRAGMEREEPGPAGCQKSPKENSINQKSVVFRCSQGDGHQLLDDENDDDQVEVETENLADVVIASG